jgi:alanine racemase
MTQHQPGIPSPLRLRFDGNALIHNWRWLAGQGGAATCGAAVKADGYGLGAKEVVRRLRTVGCCDFFVATWAEAAALAAAGQGAGVAVLHGVRAEDMPLALALPAVRPVLNTAQQVLRWRAAAPARACDIMVDTGMNRLGLSAEEATSGLLDGLFIDTLMSHLVSADEDSDQNATQLAAFRSLAAVVPARRISLANSAGICLGGDYAFGLTRPGLALYGAVPRREALGHVRQVVFPEAQVLQRRRVAAGGSVGYNATWRAAADTDVVIANLGYADGYLRAFSGRGGAVFGGHALSGIGRVSMDLTAWAVPPGCTIAEGDWLAIDFDLATASTNSGLSPYELLTSLSRRYDRIWV